MNIPPLGAFVSNCGMCGCRFLSAERALHSCVGEIKARDFEIVRLTGERDEWRTLAQQLRAREAQISGVLCDVDESHDGSMRLTLGTIRRLMAGGSS